MTRHDFGDFYEDIYGYELEWIYEDYDGVQTKYCQFFLDYELDKAQEIGRRLKASERFVKVKLYFLTDFWIIANPGFGHSASFLPPWPTC